MVIVEQQVQGCIKFYYQDKGWGYFRRLDGKRDVFIHRNDLGHRSLYLTHIYTFDIQSTARGLSACNVKM